tara:strand:+ start:320 stop:562 length:243 start_codon:yes stop_codon:yes gene_type:complete
MKNLDILNFSSLTKLKYFPDLRKVERNDNTSEIFCIKNRELIKTFFISLIVKDLKIKTKINMIINREIKFIKSSTVMLLG